MRPTPAQARALARGGPWDALAATLGRDAAEMLRRAIPAGVDPAAVEHALLRALLRREAHAGLGPVERRDLDESLRAVERACHRLRRDFPLLAWGAGFEEALARVRKSARALGLPAGRGRPRWRADAEAEVRALGLGRAAARRLAELAGLDGPSPRRKPA